LRENLPLLRRTQAAPNTTRSSAPDGLLGGEERPATIAPGAAIPDGLALGPELASERQLADRAAINELWGRFMHLRARLAENAGFPNYLDYRWQQMLRLDYTPLDSLKFQQAIEQVVVPAAARMYEKRRLKLGVEQLRPWDLDQDLYPLDLPPLPAMAALRTPARRGGLPPGGSATGRLFSHLTG
jgi:hypothetical protein